MVAAAVVLLAPARPTIRERSSRVVAAMARVLLSARLEPGSGVCVKSSRRHRMPGASRPRHGRVRSGSPKRCPHCPRTGARSHISSSLVAQSNHPSGSAGKTELRDLPSFVAAEPRNPQEVRPGAAADLHLFVYLRRTARRVPRLSWRARKFRFAQRRARLEEGELACAVE